MFFFQDWLSLEFPRARILAIDASLNPFVWDPICPVDKLERTMDTRAKKLLPQLSAAGVGRRPIIWVTHSAGGILVKELLRFSRKPFSDVTEHTVINAFSDSVQSDSPQSTLDFRLPEVFEPKPDVLGTQSLSPQTNWFCDSSDESVLPANQPGHFDIRDPLDPISGHACASECFTPRTSELEAFKDFPEGDSDLTNSTKGIIFLSAPHRGNRSLLALYRRPFRWTLTPEAIQLERNSQFLLDLHAWFNTWAVRARVKVLTMVETKETPVNRFWSVLLVPEDTLDREMGEVVRIDSDHTYISKPKSPTDLMYQHLVKFIRNVC
ncbi:unnamed protein product [Dicrocoelium dendriticum]|nr:unnamed protein product [Dicrocoelium dendriticum]